MSIKLDYFNESASPKVRHYNYYRSRSEWGCPRRHYWPGVSSQAPDSIIRIKH